MDERRLGRSKHVALVSFLSAILTTSSARAQPAAPPTPVPTAPAGAATSPPASGGTSATSAPTNPPVTPSPPPTPAQLAEAKKFFEAGLKLLKEQLYQEALASFLEAYRLSPRESIQNNIAISHRNLKDFASAYGAYEELLARFGDKMKPAAKADAQRALEELAILTGVIAIKIQEPDAKVTVDGKEVGKTPLAKPVRVNIGTHQVAITKPGFETIAKDVTLRGHDEASVDGPLEKEILTGHLNVTFATPLDPTAKVIVDGKEVGPAPWQGDLEPGTHTIEARGDTSVALPKQIDVAKKAKIDLPLDLKAAEGFVVISTGTPDAEITIDGKLLGRGVWEGRVPIGKHNIAIVKAGFLSYGNSVLVHLDERVTENVRLQPEKPVDVAPPHDWRGSYSQLMFVGAFVIGSPSNDIAQGRDLTSDTVVNGSGGFGGGLDLRVGYSFGFLGVEGILAGGYDHWSADVTYNANQSTAQHPGGERTETYNFHRFGGSAGIGVRLMPKIQTARPTFALGGGISFKTAIYNRDSSGPTGSNSFPSDATSYVAPMMVMDGGVEPGKTPGTRFYIGARLLLEFPGGATATVSGSPPTAGAPPPTNPLDLANGTDVFFGPILGMQFGE